MPIEIDDRGEARRVLSDYEMTERAIDQAFQPIASSLIVGGRKGVEKIQAERKDALKKWSADHGNEPVEDGELDVRTRMEESKAAATYDIETLLKTKDGEAHLLEAARRGYVRIDDTMLKDFRKRTPGATWADAIWMSRMQFGGTPRFYIDRGH